MVWSDILNLEAPLCIKNTTSDRYALSETSIGVCNDFK